MFCKMCGKKIQDGSKFCPYCGASVDMKESEILTNLETVDNTGERMTGSKKKKYQEKEEYEQEENVKTKKKLKMVVLLIILAVVVISVWNGLRRKNVSDEKRTENEYTTEEQIQEIEKETKIAVPFAEGGEAESSDGITPEEYILPECEIRIYTKEELSSLSGDELRLARNEIYARHGRKFDSEDLRNYFQSKSWYTPQYEGADFDVKGDSVLNEYELANRNLIVELEGGTTESVEKAYIWINTAKMEAGSCYLEGDYIDLIDTGEECEFHYDIVTKEKNIMVVINSNTKYNFCSNMEDVYRTVRNGLAAYGNYILGVEKKGNQVTNVMSGYCMP